MGGHQYLLPPQLAGSFGASQPPAAAGQDTALAARALASKPAAFLGGILLGVEKKAWPE